MRSLSFNRPRATALLLAVMFIFADMALPQTMEGWKMLEDEQSPERAVSTHAIHADSYISENNPTNSYNTSATGMLSNEMLQESRLLLRFPMNYTASDTIHSATVNLQCTTTDLGSTDMHAYVASMDRMWNGS